MIDYERLYAYRFRDIDQAAKRAVWSEIARFLHAQLGHPGRVLDPAAGSCEFINAVPAEERWAVDRMSFEGKDVAPGTNLIVADVMDAELPDAHFDGSLVSNFLEHLPSQDAIGAFLARMHGWTAPGGRIAVLGPNYRHCARSYWDFADHTIALTHLAIAEHLYAAGFEPIAVHPQFLPFSFTGRLPPSRTLTRLYLRTPAAWRLLGKQFLVIGRK